MPELPTRDHPVGQIPKLQKHVIEKIVNALRAGNYRETAALYAGVSDASLFAWLARARKDREAGKVSRYTELLDAVEKAESEAEVRAVATIQKAAQDVWTAQAWWLERKFPQRWGRRDHTEVSGSGGGPVRVVFGGRYLPTGEKTDED